MISACQIGLSCAFSTFPPPRRSSRTLISALVDGRLIEGFDARQHPERLGDATLYLPTRRACQWRAIHSLRFCSVKRCCCRESSPSATSTKTNWHLPRPPNPMRSTLPPLEPLRRRLMLGRLIASWAERVKPKDPDDPLLVVTGPVPALNLADSVGAADGRHGDAAGAVGRARQSEVPTDVDQYWQLTRGFIDAIVRELGPRYSVAARRDGAGRAPRRASIAAWRAVNGSGDHAKGPVDYRPAPLDRYPAARFRSTPSQRLPQGAVVLPGLGTHPGSTTPGGRLRARATTPARRRRPRRLHPQFAMQALLYAHRRVARPMGVIAYRSAALSRSVAVGSDAAGTDDCSQWRERLSQPAIKEGRRGAACKMSASIRSRKLGRKAPHTLPS